MSHLRELVDYREFLKEFTLHQFRARYRGSILGLLWLLLVPLLTFCVFLFVFGFLLRAADWTAFAPRFFGGFVPWTLFATVTIGATFSVIGNSHLATRIYVPKVVFPLSVFAIGVVEFFALTLALLLFLPFMGIEYQGTMLLFPIALVLLTPFVIGVSLFVAAISVFLRDVPFLWGVLIQLWFFCTPILYSLESIPPRFRSVLELNPMFPYVLTFQQLVAGRVPDPDILLQGAVIGAIALIIGTTTFVRSQRAFYAYL